MEEWQHKLKGTFILSVIVIGSYVDLFGKEFLYNKGEKLENKLFTFIA